MSQRIRLDPAIRKLQILSAALNIAKEKGYHEISFTEVAAQLNLKRGSIIYYFANLKLLKKAVMRLAIKQKEMGILAQGLASLDPLLKNIPLALKEEVIRHLRN